jgi:hypothetical protein
VWTTQLLGLNFFWRSWESIPTWISIRLWKPKAFYMTFSHSFC